jgi:hypothetical protein
MPDHGLKSKGIAVNVSEKISFHGNPFALHAGGFSIACRQKIYCPFFSQRKGILHQVNGIESEVNELDIEIIIIDRLN